MIGSSNYNSSVFISAISRSWNAAQYCLIEHKEPARPEHSAWLRWQG